MREGKASISLLVTDGAGQPLVVRAVVYTEDWGFSDVAYTGGDGKVSFGELPAAPLVLEVSRGPLWSRDESALTLRPGEAAQRHITLTRIFDPRLRGWYAGDPHIHSSYSDGKQTPDELAHAARAAELSWCALTDHDTIAGGQEWLATRRSDFLPILGEEVSTGVGHILLLGVREAVPPAEQPTREEVRRIIAQARAQGGAVFVAHPSYPVPELGFTFWDIEDLDGVEVIHQGSLPPMACGSPKPDLQSEELWLSFLEQGRRLAPIGSTDCHDITNGLQRLALRDPEAALQRLPELRPVVEAVGWARARLWARLGNTVGTQRTYLRAATLDDESIRRGLIAGRTVVSNGPFLLVSTPEGHGPGDRIVMNGKEAVFQVQAWFNRPLRGLIVRSGRRVVMKKRLDGRTTAEVELRIPAGKCGGGPLVFQVCGDEPYSAATGAVYG